VCVHVCVNVQSIDPTVWANNSVHGQPTLPMYRGQGRQFVVGFQELNNLYQIELGLIGMPAEQNRRAT